MYNRNVYDLSVSLSAMVLLSVFYCNFYSAFLPPKNICFKVVPQSCIYDTASGGDP